MQSYAEPKKKKGVIIGCSKGNIGSEIFNYLVEKGHHVVENSVICENDNLLVISSGCSELGWIGDGLERMDHVRNANFSVPVDRIEKFVALTKDNKEVKRIIIIGSMAYNNVLNGSSVYCATKAAINQYAKCAAYELAKYGYLVTVINPGNVLDTPMTTKVKEQLCILHDLNPHDAEDYWGKVNNLGEFITKRDIAKMVKFLLKPEARFLSGSSLDLRGSNR